MIDPNIYGIHKEYFEEMIMGIYCAHNRIVTWSYVEDIYARHVQPYEAAILAHALNEEPEDEEARRDIITDDVGTILREATEI